MLDCCRGGLSVTSSWLASWSARCFGRSNPVAELSSPESISDWQDWRADVQEQKAHPGPVERRVPKRRLEPPALVLLRDFFAVLMFGALLFQLDAVSWIMAWFAIGIMTSRQVSKLNI